MDPKVLGEIQLPTPGRQGLPLIPEDAGDRREMFDLMQVHITIYSLTGMAIRPNEKAIKRMQAKESRASKESLASKDSQARKKVSGLVVADTLSTIPTETTVPDIPTTAVVSFRRNVVSSGTVIETFLPSQSLKMPSLDFTTYMKQKAYWHGAECSSILEVDGNGTEYATYNITRVMQRQSYRPDVSLREIANYMPETIEIRVGVGRGKEIFSLGVASVSITGDEEGETVTTIPVKVFTPMQSKRNLFRQNSEKTKRTRRAVFSDDPVWRYSLDENATLRVGVKVSPCETGKSSKAWQPQKTKTLDEILEGMYDENMVIELDDENSLLEQFMGFPKERAQAEAKKTDKQLSFASFFCGALPLCAPMVGDVPCSPRPTGNTGAVRQEIKVGSKKTEAVVLSLSMMSSVSESTFGSEIDSPISFGQQRATF